MWCPKDWYSWSYVISYLTEASRKILSLVDAENIPSEQDGELAQVLHAAEFKLKSMGIADDRENVELRVAITTCFLLSKFLEDFPPVLASLRSDTVDVDRVFFEHRDQLDYCTFAWPLEDDSQFRFFFEFAKAGVFKASNIFDRFAFIDPHTGEICVKNGSKDFLMGYVVDSDTQADKIIEMAHKLSGYIVCWPDVPDEREFRNFLSYLEVNDTFTAALDKGFGIATEDAQPQEKRPIGRPSKRQAASQEYWNHFPEGHDKAGKTWKEALRSVNTTIDVPVEITTLKRAVRMGGQKQQK